MSNHSAGGQIGTAIRTLRRFWPFAVPDRKLLIYGGALAILAAGIAIFIWHPVAGNSIQILTGWNRVVFCAASIAIVFGFYKHGFGLGRIFAFPLTQLGLATYGVYLLHPLVWQAFSQLFGLLHVQSTPAAMIGTTT